ncbi:MAG: glycoside hydrolase family 5 protein [Eubacteriales bacterium]|nr:glycoside hydrolase family 5 protein [Eubacteriales bacterium]
MKKIIGLLCMLLILALYGCGSNGSGDGYISPNNCGKLKVENGTLCDHKGNPVQLKGVSTSSITRVEKFLNPELFEEMRNDWGVNVIRLCMYVSAMDGYTKNDYYKETNTQLVKNGVALAKEADLYAIIDWHVLDEKTPLRYVKEAKEFFDMMSKEYKDETHVIYEICNEPNETSWSEIKEYANQVIPIIRANDPDALIICGTPDWSQGVDQALEDPLDFENVMYTLHFYAASHKEELRERMVKCSEAGLPIFVTEYGVTANTGGFPRDFDSSDLWMKAMDEHNISNCIWNLSKNGEACVLIKKGTLEYNGFTEEDMTETGEWFLDMMKKYKEHNGN